MSVIAINGSPRKKWNTATLLEHALEGASAHGSKTELVHLYDLNYQGCRSCFACKLKSGHSYGQCAVNDGLKPLLQKLEEAEALILGSPIYYGMVSGEMRSFLERLLFPYLVYDTQYSSLRRKRIPAGVIYTMNIDQSGLETRNYPAALGPMEAAIQRTLSQAAVRSLYVTDTCQFEDYAKYEVTAFKGELKVQRRETEFPHDCRRAFELGWQLVDPGCRESV